MEVRQQQPTPNEEGPVIYEVPYEEEGSYITMTSPANTPGHGPAHIPDGINPLPLPPKNQAGVSPVALLRQKEREIHMLRMSVMDKDVNIGKLTRDLSHCHEQLKYTNARLSEKKEDILRYQDQIASMRAELAELRDTAMGGIDGSKDTGTSTEAERALQNQVDQLSRQTTNLHRQLEEQRRRNEQLHDGRGRAMHGGDQLDTHNLRAQRDHARTELDGVRRQSLEQKSRIDVLEVQDAIYKEDFNSERLDRERAHAELHACKDECKSLKQALQLLATEQDIHLGPAGQHN